VKIDALLRGGLGEAPAEAAAAQACGYDGVHSSELNHDPFLLLARAAVLSVECERYRAVHLAPLVPLRREAEKSFARAQHAYAQARGKGPCVVRSW